MSLSLKGTDNYPIFFAEGGRWDQSHLVKWGLGIAFGLGVFLFLHYGDSYTEALSLSAPSPHYIVAQTDFSYLDEEATALAKEEAVKGIDFIRSVSDSECTARMNSLYRWLKQSRHSHLEVEEIYRVSEVLLRELKRVVFVSEKTRDLLRLYKIPIDHGIVWHTGRDDAAERLPRFIWDDVARVAVSNFGSSIDQGAMHKVLDFLSHRRWKIEVDAHFQSQLRKRICDEIPPVIRELRAGATLIDQGDIVTQRHLDMLRAMKEALKQQRRLSSWHALATLPIAVVAISLAGLYFFAFHRSVFSSNRQLTLLLFICGATLSFAKAAEIALFGGAHGNFGAAADPLIAPFTAIMAAAFFPLSAAAFACVFMTIILSMGLPVESAPFLTINFVGAIISLVNARRLVKQRDLFQIGLQVWFGASIAASAIYLHTHATVLIGVEMTQQWVVLGVSTLVIAAAVLVTLPFLEMIFGIVTEMALLEFLDPNSPLLRRLSIEAPGTYQHSLFVSHLAESAALAINARSLFCRVSGLYHDIGKLAYPHYFVENQRDINVHLLLTPSESAHAILGHVTEGVCLARQHHLPEPLVQIIKEHHGTGLVNYFYSCECELLGDEDKVDQGSFRYRGPIPQTKESLIIMLCDTLEAISRSLEHVSEAKVEEILNNQIGWLISSGQFDANPMSLSELHLVKENLVKTLVAANHSRVKYEIRARPASREGLPRAALANINPGYLGRTGTSEGATLASSR